MTNERTEAIALANRLLDEPNCDPDDELRILSRHLLRMHEGNARLMHDIEAGNAEIERLCKLHGPHVEPTPPHEKNDPHHNFIPGPALCPHPLDSHSIAVGGVEFCAACGSTLNRT